MTCTCRTSATCPDHLAETDLTLEHVPMGSQTRVEPHLMDRMGAWSEDGQAWFAREHFPKRSQAMQHFSSITDVPYIEISCLARHARWAPDEPGADYYDGDYWVECDPDEPGAFPVWRCE